MKYCSRCKKIMTYNATFCQSCGAPQTKSTAVSQESAKTCIKYCPKCNNSMWYAQTKCHKCEKPSLKNTEALQKSITSTEEENKTEQGKKTRIYCSQCGNELHTSMRFCGSCGGAINRKNTPHYPKTTSSDTQRSGDGVVQTSIGVILTIGGIIGIRYFQNFINDPLFRMFYGGFVFGGCNQPFFTCTECERLTWIIVGSVFALCVGVIFFVHGMKELRENKR